MDPKMPISVNNITWYYGTYAEVIINNNTSIYNGVGINATVSISTTNNLQIPINATYTLNVGSSTETITETLQPGVNIVNMTAPALGQGVYNASLTISAVGYSLTYYFTVSYLTPGIVISTTITKLYSGLPQQVVISIGNSTPIPITSISMVVTGINALVSTGVISAKPPTNVSITLTPGSYLLNNASLIVRATYIDAGGYTWSSNYTLTIPIVQTPVTLTVSMQSYTASYGSTLPITITAKTPIGPLQNQPLNIYVDNNYVTTVTTNNVGIAQYALPINYSVGPHTLMISFTNATYFQSATVNYTFTVVPGTVYITAYVNSTNITYGNAVSMSIALSPPITGGTLTISYVVNGTSSIIGSYTPINGNVQVTWIPPQAGVYVITIYYQNPPNYLPSSTNMTLTVNKASCTISIIINGTPVVFHDVLIIGRMNPTIVNAKVNVVISGRNYITSGVMYINSSGLGEYVFTPQFPGNYEVLVSWPGDINYESCQADYVLDINKASLRMNVEENRNLIAMGGNVVFTIDLITDIPTNYISGNITIMIESDRGTVNVLTIPIKGTHLVATVPFYEAGSYRVIIMYPGNDYVNSTKYGPYYVTVLPGMLGIPWYIFIAYLVPLGLGATLGMLVSRKIIRQ